MDGNTSESLWDNSTHGTLNPSGGNISYIGYRYIVDENMARMYLAFQYVDDKGASSSRAVVSLNNGQSFTLSANNSASNSGVRYQSRILRNTDVMMEAEITADMSAVNRASVTVYDSSGQSSGTHQISIQKTGKPEPEKQTTTAPAQQNPGGDQNQTPQNNEGNVGNNGGSGQNLSGGNTPAAAPTPTPDQNAVDADGESMPVDVSESETGMELPHNNRSYNVLYPIGIVILLGIIAVLVSIVYRQKRKNRNG